MTTVLFVQYWTSHVELKVSLRKSAKSAIYSSAGLMPTEARGNYFPEPPLLKRDKRPITASHSSRYDMLAVISFRYQYGPFFYFLLQKLCQIT